MDQGDKLLSQVMWFPWMLMEPGNTSGWVRGCFTKAAPASRMIAWPPSGSLARALSVRGLPDMRGLVLRHNRQAGFRERIVDPVRDMKAGGFSCPLSPPCAWRDHGLHAI
jgi:hypothetical protein